MTYVTGLFLIDANASALNNLGAIEGERYDNSTGVKVIRANDGVYPYVSAQAFRYWLRQTLQQNDLGWKSAPIYREEKIAYTDANPIKWWDDDLFGYMRAPSKRESAKAKREADSSREGETETTDTITRTSPFRVSTLISIAPIIRPTNDFGVMSRQDGDPVPHEHQFYRTTLQGLFSLSLKASGTFWYRKKTGFRNLDDIRIEQAKAENLELLEDEKAYRLPKDQRLQRITSLFEGMAKLEGGAKQSIHYTDVSPVVVILAVTKGGNHIFGHVIGENRGRPEVNREALKESLQIFNDEIVSDIFIGWVHGYSEDERTRIEAFAKTAEAKTKNGKAIKLSHPREAFQNLIAEMKKPENISWLE